LNYTVLKTIDLFIAAVFRKLFWGAGNWIHGFMHAKHILYRWFTFPSQRIFLILFLLAYIKVYLVKGFITFPYVHIMCFGHIYPLYYSFFFFLLLFIIPSFYPPFPFPFHLLDSPLYTFRK
jgi:hypothetical protein